MSSLGLTVSGAPSGSLLGKNAVISGASSGIGAAIARELSRLGAHVVINYPFMSEREQAQQVLNSLEGPLHGIVVEADISTLSGPRDLIQAAVAEFGHIDILVNNAGISALSVLDEGTDEEIARIWDSVVAVNGRGTMMLTRAALPHLSRSHSRIVNICSSTSRNPDANMTIYAGSKGMIESFTRCWARDLPRKYGCTVNAVAPGPVSTEQMLSSPQEFQDMLAAGFDRVPVAPRMAKPEEIAWTVSMLCDEKAGWLNGLYILATGGSTLS